MIPIAHPLASAQMEEILFSTMQSMMSGGRISTGIKKCQKRILDGSRGLLVLTADTTPMDLITHLPALCEDRDVKYIFVRSKSSIPSGFTCVFLESDGSGPLEEILNTLG